MSNYTSFFPHVYSESRFLCWAPQCHLVAGKPPVGHPWCELLRDCHNLNYQTHDIFSPFSCERCSLFCKTFAFKM